VPRHAVSESGRRPRAARDADVRRQPVRIALDLDNTIACYDEVFSSEARARGLVDDSVAADKTSVRDHLRARGRDDDWTELQGWAYGPGMSGAAPYAGLQRFLTMCVERQVEVYVVSHRSRKPYLGPPYDLHEAAMRWLESRGIVGGHWGLDASRVHLETSAQAKADRVVALGCSQAVDDLPEFLEQLAIRGIPTCIHFDPSGRHLHERCRLGFRCVDSWHEIGDVVFASIDGGD